MIALKSQLEGTEHRLFALEETLKPLGYSIEVNWDYNHGCFDYMINDKNDLFLRIPFTATEGTLDCHGAEVEVGAPYLSNHKYEPGLEQAVGGSPFDGVTNQLQIPEYQDTHIPERYAETGRHCLREAENAVFSIE